jgi:hypothetical protein
MASNLAAETLADDEKWRRVVPTCPGKTGSLNDTLPRLSPKPKDRPGEKYHERQPSEDDPHPRLANVAALATRKSPHSDDAEDNS